MHRRFWDSPPPPPQGSVPPPPLLGLFFRREPGPGRWVGVLRNAAACGCAFFALRRFPIAARFSFAISCLSAASFYPVWAPLFSFRFSLSAAFFYSVQANLFSFQLLFAYFACVYTS
jgi:hypothetical protein